MVRPALVKTKFGNGKRLVGLMAIMHRPNYYLVWIDDSWDLNNGDQWLDKLDDIWNAISEEFGSRPYDSNRRYEWPEEDSSDGCVWFEADESDVLPARMRRRYLPNAKGKS